MTCHHFLQSAMKYSKVEETQKSRLYFENDACKAEREIKSWHKLSSEEEWLQKTCWSMNKKTNLHSLEEGFSQSFLWQDRNFSTLKWCRWRKNWIVKQTSGFHSTHDEEKRSATETRSKKEVIDVSSRLSNKTNTTHICGFPSEVKGSMSCI